MSNSDGSTISQASRRLELPPVAAPSQRGLLRGREISLLYDECRSPAVMAEHKHQELQIGLLFEPATYLLSWRMPSGEPREQRLVGPQVYLVAPGQVHACQCGNRDRIAEALRRGKLLAALRETEDGWRLNR